MVRVQAGQVTIYITQNCRSRIVVVCRVVVVCGTKVESPSLCRSDEYLYLSAFAREEVQCEPAQQETKDTIFESRHEGQSEDKDD